MIIAKEKIHSHTKSTVYAEKGDELELTGQSGNVLFLRNKKSSECFPADENKVTSFVTQKEEAIRVNTFKVKIDFGAPLQKIETKAKVIPQKINKPLDNTLKLF